MMLNDIQNKSNTNFRAKSLKCLLERFYHVSLMQSVGNNEKIFISRFKQRLRDTFL